MNPLVYKIFATLIIFGSGVIGGLLPLRIELSKRGNKLITYGNAFAGGIFLGAGLIHMLPDAQEKFQTLQMATAYPISTLLCSCGFFLTLFLEKVLIRESDLFKLPAGLTLTPFILLLILSVHSIIAGISLGLEKTLMASVVLFIAIIAHKGTAAFALGTSLRSARADGLQLKRIIFFFSTMTPLGILLGWIFSTLATSSTATALEAIFDSLAAGTFLYIATLDTVSSVFQNREDRWHNFGLIFIAFIFMALLALWL